ncbi:helix-turn-helix domain-containing protein [uncultured Duncaniella sp.]|uniref:helix-turn-helix domain-containing protein n=1 Tax=uncultured Duncaniella sp. TaxID=2768039 RepID=UPI0026262558|nr:helix-turn-helix transcriptional regulator [uncultured Duncaniella sp.]
MYTNKILSILDAYMADNPGDIGKGIAEDFKRRRVERGMTREEVAREAGISVSNLIRFERTGLISLHNLIALAISFGYVSEIKNIFSEPKFTTLEELSFIRKNANRKRGHKNENRPPFSQLP